MSRKSAGSPSAVGSKEEARGAAAAGGAGAAKAAAGAYTWEGAALAKWAVARVALDAGLDVLLTDVDAVPLRNPLSYIDTLPRGCDAYFTTDATYLNPSSQVWYPGLPRRRVWWAPFLLAGGPGGAIHNYLSAGFVFLRAGPAAQAVVGDVLRLLAAVARDHEEGGAGGGGARVAAAWATVGLGVAPEEGGGGSGGRTAAAAGAAAVQPPTAVDLARLASEESVLNAVLQRAYERAADESHPVPSLAGRGSCANYGGLSFFVLSPYLFQNGAHARDLKLTDVIREPPFTRHFSFLSHGGLDAFHGLVPGAMGGPPGGSGAAAPDADGAPRVADVAMPEKAAFMRDFGAWLLGAEEERALQCRAILAGALQPAAVGSGAAVGAAAR